MTSRAGKPESSPVTEALDIGLRALRWIVLALLAVALIRGCLLSVDQHEIAFVLRWGRVAGTGTARARAPGLHVVRPYPLDQVVRVPAQRVQTLTSYAFWHDPPPGVAGGGYTMTADANILHSAWAARYTLRDPEQFVFRFHDAPAVLRHELERAILSASGMFDVDAIVRGAREFAGAVERILRARCAALELGVGLERVELLMLSPPPPARAAFEDALRAEQDHSARVHAARLDQNRLLNEARAEAAGIAARAAGARARMLGEVQAESDYFTRILPEYARQPGLVRRILLQERLRKALAQADSVYLVGGGGVNDRELRLNIGPAPAWGPRVTVE